MIIYGGLSGLSRAVPWGSWGRLLDPDFVQYLVYGLRRLIRENDTFDVNLISGFRTYAKQAALYRQNPRKAARPGLSQHEYGYAIDATIILPRTSNTLERLLQIFGIPYESSQELRQAILRHIWADNLNVPNYDPGHVAYYPDGEWSEALAAAGYFDAYRQAALSSYDPCAQYPPYLAGCGGFTGVSGGDLPSPSYQ